MLHATFWLFFCRNILVSARYEVGNHFWIFLKEGFQLSVLKSVSQMSQVTSAPPLGQVQVMSSLSFSPSFSSSFFFFFPHSFIISLSLLSSFAAFVSLVLLWFAFDYLWHMCVHIYWIVTTLISIGSILYFHCNCTVCIFVFWYFVVKTLDMLLASSLNLL